MSLLNRGFVYAIAHVRGGGELGQQWYEDGKFLCKKNTFNDYLDVCDALLAQGYGDPRLCYGMGGSAGGMLMGVAVNERPELFHGVIAQVPFVDVVTTMLDETIPLTTGEFEEWGNPQDETYYHYMKSYSPYDCYITAALLLDIINVSGWTPDEMADITGRPALLTTFTFGKY
ncbi:prolyl oligopeptidase family serine peptidase, partial [Klebsiella pneumoniae]|uniref:prolyl oligopeptidase family serine peptidase n=1 Tax=Klebsiella pneumoniae TaxID=573 RepID=UPI003EE2E757